MNKLLSSPAATNVMIYGGVAAVVFLLLPKLLPKLIDGAATFVGDSASALATGTARVAGQGVRAVTPTNPDNVIYRAGNEFGAAASGQNPGSFTLGGWLYDLTHPGEYTTSGAPIGSGTSGSTAKRN